MSPAWAGPKWADLISNVPKSPSPRGPQPFQCLGPGKGHGEGATHTALNSSLL